MLDSADEPLLIASQRAYQALCTVIKNGQQAGLYIDRDTNELALALWSMVHGFSLLAIGKHIGYDTIDTPQKSEYLCQQLCAMLLSGILV